ncbi:MAG TPA: cadherin repeat domain-containing protein [Allosphingosinicella sp.]
MTEYYAPAGGQAAANTIVSGVQAAPRAAKLLNGHVVVWEDRSASPDDTSFAIRGQLFDSAGNKSGSEFLVNSVTAGNQTAPSVAALAGGGFVVAWTGTDSSGTGVKAQIFTAAGAKSGAEFQVNTGTSENQNGAQVVAVPGLGFAVVWLDYSGTGNAIRGQYYRTDGTTYGSQFTVSSSTAEIHSDIAVAAVGDGNSRIAVSWTQTNGDPSGSAALARVIKADGIAVGGTFALGQAVAGDQRDAALALYAPSKGFVAVYVDEGEGGAVKLRKFSPEGVALGADLRLTAAGERGDSPSILAFASGMLAVSWIDGNGNQRVQMVNATGDALGGGLALGPSGDPAALVALGTETFLAAWSDGDVQTRAFKPAGPAVSDIAISDTVLSEAIPANLSVAQLAASGIGGSSGFTYSLVGDSTGGAFAVRGDRLILADPSRIDFETAPTAQVTVRATDSQGLYRDETYALAVSDSAEAAPGWTVSAPFAPNAAAWGPTVPKLASLASGGFVMVYFDSRFSSPTSGDSPVRGRLYSASGEAAGPEFKVSILQDDNQHPVDVTGLAGGGFAVMFSDYREGFGNTGAQLRVQLFDSHGVAVSGQIKVATTGSGGQSGSLAALPNGGFVVTFANGWSGTVPTVSDIKAQIFDSAGNKVGGEMVVPSSNGWPQGDPAVAVLSDGGFIIAWTDRSNASIDAQRFDSAGTRVGASFRVSSSAQYHYDPSVAGLAAAASSSPGTTESGSGSPLPIRGTWSARSSMRRATKWAASSRSIRTRPGASASEWWSRSSTADSS